MSKETGGPAFPFEYDYLNNDGSWSRNFEQGQTLRDHFAGLALQSIPLSLGRNEQLVIARAACSQADFMLRARGE